MNSYWWWRTEIVGRWYLAEIGCLCQSENLLELLRWTDEGQWAQYCFTPGKETQSLLEEFADIVRNAFDHSCVVTSLFRDLTKAFDTVIHDLLLIKRFSRGFRGLLYAWLKNLLKIPDVVKSCDAQWTLLYHYRVSNLTDVIRHCGPYQYADDAVLTSVHANHGQDAFAVYGWFSLNCMQLNVSKIQLIAFHNPLRSRDFGQFIVFHSSSCTECACVALPFAGSVSGSLGIHFDSDMSRATHCVPDWDQFHAFGIVSVLLFRLLYASWFWKVLPAVLCVVELPFTLVVVRPGYVEWMEY